MTIVIWVVPHKLLSSALNKTVWMAQRGAPSKILLHLDLITFHIRIASFDGCCENELNSIQHDARAHNFIAIKTAPAQSYIFSISINMFLMIGSYCCRRPHVSLSQKSAVYPTKACLLSMSSTYFLLEWNRKTLTEYFALLGFHSGQTFEFETVLIDRISTRNTKNQRPDDILIDSMSTNYCTRQSFSLMLMDTFVFIEFMLVNRCQIPYSFTMWMKTLSFILKRIDWTEVKSPESDEQLTLIHELTQFHQSQYTPHNNHINFA